MQPLKWHVWRLHRKMLSRKEGKNLNTFWLQQNEIISVDKDQKGVLKK